MSCRLCSYYLSDHSRYCRSKVSCRKTNCSRFCWRHARTVRCYSKLTGCSSHAPELVILFLAYQGVWHKRIWEEWRRRHGTIDDIQFIVHADNVVQVYNTDMTVRLNVLDPVPTSWCSNDIVYGIVKMMEQALVLWPGAKRFCIIPGDSIPIAEASEFLTVEEGRNIINYNFVDDIDESVQNILDEQDDAVY